MRFDCDGAEVDVDEQGRITTVTPHARPGLVYLRDVGEVELERGGEPARWSAPDLSVDTDEVEVRREAAGLTLVVRHSFAAGWGLRVAVTNTADHPVTLERLQVGCVPGPGCVGWALAAGATGAYAVQPTDAEGPVLGGLLTLGDLDRITATGLFTECVRLAPGARYVLAWRWAWAATPRQLGGGRLLELREVPAAFYRTAGETARLPADDDRVLLAPPEVGVDSFEDILELTVWNPGTYPVELRTARGTTRYDLTWAEPVVDLLERAAAKVLGGPRTAAGVVRVVDVDAALVLQHALRSSRVADPDTAAEALDLFVARLGEDPPTDPRVICLLAAELGRTGELDALAGATAGLLATVLPSPGLGLAGSQVTLASVLSGQGPGPAMRHLAGLALLGGPGAGSLTDQVSDLELLALSPDEGRDRVGAASEPAEDLTARLLAVATAVGSGLKGRPLAPLPVRGLAQLAAVLTLLPEAASASAEPVWGCTAHELARHLTAEVVSRLGDAPLGPAHAWLALGSATG